MFCTGCGSARESGLHPEPTSSQEERRRVSVLFVDLIDFTPYVERADPELVRGMQTGFFSAARRVIGQYGGVVEKYIGDAVMALFGAPVATETDALRCVRAGLELQRVLARFAPTGSDGLRFRVGVATGEAIVDLAAARDGGQAIVAGDVVNTSSRMQAIAPAGGVLVCGTTYALTRSAVRYHEHEAVTLRGRSSPTEVWLALAPVQRQHSEPEPDAIPLVDREHELGMLINALHRSLGERLPQLVTVFGRAGLGKSRLIRELYRHAERLIDTPVVWRTGYCPPFGDDGAFAALADIVKAETGILDTDTAPTAASRLTGAVRELVGPVEAERLVDALRPLVGLPGPKLPAEEAQSAWRRFLVAVASRRPTVLVFEDVHCADEAMRRFIELLGAATRDVPLLILCTARPELIDRDPTWAGTIAGSLTITLPPLRNNGIATLFAHLFGKAAFSADLLSPLVELADGNPLYAQEYVRMLIERGAVRHGGRGWALDRRQDLPMPDSVHSVIANRIDLLDPPDRMVLLAASVVGAQFWPGAVAAALGRPVESVERSLRRLEQREFVYEQPESTMAGQSEFRFRHVLVRDVCYQRLPRTERVARHERTAGWLDELSSTRHTDLAEALAHHRWAAYQIARDMGVDTRRYAPAARDALYRSARRAYSLHALDAAAAQVARALTLFQPIQPAVPGAPGPVQPAVPGAPTGTPGAGGEQPPRPAPLLVGAPLVPGSTARAECAAEGPSDAESRERLRLELFSTEIAFHRDQSGFLAGGGAGQLGRLAEQLLGRAEPGLAARACTLLGQVAWLQADRGAALSHLDRAVRLFDGEPDSPDKADAYAELGRLHMLNGDRDPAVAAAGTAARIAERLGLAEVRADARITVGYAHYQAGDRAGLEELESVWEFCRAHQLLAARRAARNLAAAVLEEGDYRRMNSLLAEGRKAAQGRPSLGTDWSQEAMEAYYSGDLDRLLSAADAFAAASPGHWDLQVRGWRSCLRVLRGQPVPGPPRGDGLPGEVDDVSDAIRMARETGFHRVLWTSLAMGALCRALQGRTGEAEELLDELADTWSRMPALISGEWSAATANAAALCGPDPARRVLDMVDRASHLTRWGRAAHCTVSAALADSGGDHDRAGRLHLEAAEIYGWIPNNTERILALAQAAGAFNRAGDLIATAEILAEVRPFTLRNRVPGLLELALPTAGGSARSDLAS